MEKTNKKNDDLKRQRILNVFTIVYVAVLLVLVTVGIVRKLDAIPKAPIKDGVIYRTYEELLPYLDEAPEDFTKQPYEAHISEIVQNDIQKMMNSDEEVSILYENEAHTSQIAIRRFDNEKIEIAVFLDYLKDFNWMDAFVEEISFYKKDDQLIISGLCYAVMPRELVIREISLSGNVTFDYENIDLFGTEYLDNYDAIEEWNENMTLIRKGNDFKLFKNGIQQGLTTTFVGKIIKASGKYILDDKQNLYYVAYSDVPESPWIEFVKVDEDVSQVEDVSQIEMELRKKLLDEKIAQYASFPIYQKDGKRYVGISRSKVFSGGNTTPLQMINFGIDTIELSPQNVKRVELECASVRNGWWVAIFIYEEGSCLVYERKLIQTFYQEIPVEEIDLFDGISVSWEEFDETVAELEKVYQKYEEK